MYGMIHQLLVSGSSEFIQATSRSIYRLMKSRKSLSMYNVCTGAVHSPYMNDIHFIHDLEGAPAPEGPLSDVHAAITDERVWSNKFGESFSVWLDDFTGLAVMGVFSNYPCCEGNLESGLLDGTLVPSSMLVFRDASGFVGKIAYDIEGRIKGAGSFNDRFAYTTTLPDVSLEGLSAVLSHTSPVHLQAAAAYEEALREGDETESELEILPTWKNWETLAETL